MDKDKDKPSRHKRSDRCDRNHAHESPRTPHRTTTTSTTTINTTPTTASTTMPYPSPHVLFPGTPTTGTPVPTPPERRLSHHINVLSSSPHPDPTQPHPTTPTPRILHPPTHEYERIMSPPAGAAVVSPLRRRGRQATACTECNRRKQRCDGVLPCHHCRKRNVSEICVFPDTKRRVSASGSGTSGSGTSGSAAPPAVAAACTPDESRESGSASSLADKNDKDKERGIGADGNGRMDGEKQPRKRKSSTSGDDRHHKRTHATLAASPEPSPTSLSHRVTQHQAHSVAGDDHSMGRDSPPPRPSNTPTHTQTHTPGHDAQHPHHGHGAQHPHHPHDRRARWATNPRTPDMPAPYDHYTHHPIPISSERHELVTPPRGGWQGPLWVTSGDGTGHGKGEHARPHWQTDNGRDDVQSSAEVVSPRSQYPPAQRDARDAPPSQSQSQSQLQLQSQPQPQGQPQALPESRRGSRDDTYDHPTRASAMPQHDSHDHDFAPLPTRGPNPIPNPNPSASTANAAPPSPLNPQWHPHPPLHSHSHPHSRRPTPTPPHTHGTSTPAHGWSTPHSEGVLMQEGGTHGIGSLAIEGAGGEHGDQFQFYGTSHFGPRMAAQIMHRSGSGKVSLDVSDAQYGLPRGSGSGEFATNSLLYQIRQLDGALPKRSLCDRFVNAYHKQYNWWTDILYEPDFRRKYADFWRVRSEFEDLRQIDIRWFALFHVVLAFGALLERTGGDEFDAESTSYTCFVSARRALSEAPSFCGESLDTVRAYALLSLYLVLTRRVPEAWNMLGSAVNAAEAQGFHVDGQLWNLPAKEAEIRRRIWAHLYIFDRSISYFLGRPLSIRDSNFTARLPANINDDELSISPRPNRPLSEVTKSTFLILHYRLAHIIGQILSTCFGLTPRSHADVLGFEARMVEWETSLPAVFRLEDPDLRWDEQYPWLKLQRQTLKSKYYQAKISLHRPYLLHAGYTQSRIACVLSAGAELRHRLRLLETDDDPFDRFKWMTVASGFAPACVLGLLLARCRRDAQFDYAAIRDLFVQYVTTEKATRRRDSALDNEILVLDMMLAQADEVDAKLERRDRARGAGAGAGAGLRHDRDCERERERERDRVQTAPLGTHGLERRGSREHGRLMPIREAREAREGPATGRLGMERRDSRDSRDGRDCRDSRDGRDGRDLHDRDLYDRDLRDPRDPNLRDPIPSPTRQGKLHLPPIQLPQAQRVEHIPLPSPSELALSLQPQLMPWAPPMDTFLRPYSPYPGNPSPSAEFPLPVAPHAHVHSHHAQAHTQPGQPQHTQAHAPHAQPQAQHTQPHAPHTQPQAHPTTHAIPDPTNPVTPPAPTLVDDDWAAPAPWVLRPPTDPSWGDLPAPEDMAGWAGLLEFIGPVGAPEPMWYEDAVVVAE